MANPYPLYAKLRETPVFRAPNGSYVVSTYREIWALMHDPRIGVEGLAAVQAPVQAAKALAEWLPEPTCIGRGRWLSARRL